VDVGNSYEISVIILALTAKHDPEKETAKTQEAARAGKLRIKDREDAELLTHLVDNLVSRRSSAGFSRRGWRYNVPEVSLGRWRRPGQDDVPPGGAEDLSSTQLAALALFNAHRFGVRLEDRVWRDIAEFTLDQQEPDGPERRRHDPVNPDKAPVDRARGFAYVRASSDADESKATGSMTACGVANLLMVDEILTHHPRTAKSWPTSNDAERVRRGISDGLAWLDLHWSPSQNPNRGKNYHTYYLYALERAMDLLGKQLLGKNLWYREGAEVLLSLQQPAKVKILEKKGEREADGVFWNTGSTHRPCDVLDTCFTLLFLKRATKGLVPSPVVTGG
jgi:hypothetical protein